MRYITVESQEPPPKEKVKQSALEWLLNIVLIVEILVIGAVLYRYI